MDNQTCLHNGVKDIRWPCFPASAPACRTPEQKLFPPTLEISLTRPKLHRRITTPQQRTAPNRHPHRLLTGPAEKLDKTECSQPALFVAGLAAVELLKSQGPEGAAMVAGCGLTAGLSLGEYCALVFAGALSFEDGLKVRSGGS